LARRSPTVCGGTTDSAESSRAARASAAAAAAAAPAGAPRPPAAGDCERDASLSVRFYQSIARA